MDDTDAFFTQTIVGPPVSVLLGRRQDSERMATQGLEVNLPSGQARLTQFWQEWVLLGHGATPLGRPRRRPDPWRRWLERHALWIAFFGLLCLMLSAAFWFALLAGIPLPRTPWN